MKNRMEAWEVGGLPAGECEMLGALWGEFACMN